MGAAYCEPAAESLSTVGGAVKDPNLANPILADPTTDNSPWVPRSFIDDGEWSPLAR
jgi:hypothetical protein